jgi:hypothetical protein
MGDQEHPRLIHRPAAEKNAVGRKFFFTSDKNLLDSRQLHEATHQPTPTNETD